MPVVAVATTFMIAALAGRAAAAQAPLGIQARIDQLQAQVDALKAEAAAEATARKTQADGVKVAWKGAPAFSNADGSFKMKLKGKVFLDFGHLRSHAPAFGLNNDKKSQTTTEFRLLRLGIDGTVSRVFNYRVEVDLAGNKATITDAYVQWAGPLSVTIGQFKPYYSLDESTSDSFLPMMERPAYGSAFNFDRRTGIGASAHGRNWTASGGLFNTNSVRVGPNENGYLLSARVTYAPIAEKTRALHFGAAAFYRHNSQSTAYVAYKARPEAHTSGVNFVDTGSLDTKSDSFFGLETAGVYDAFSAQAEYGHLSVQQSYPGAVDPNFWGGEVTLSYFLTGESRNYRGDLGAFDRVHVAKPLGHGRGFGAVELLGRVDHLDLESGTIRGGRQTAYMLGLNWYTNDYVKFALNYSYVAIVNGYFVDANGHNKVNVLTARAQVDF